MDQIVRIRLTINILYWQSMNFHTNDHEPLGQDSEIAQKAAEFFKLIESEIALKSFEGARGILASTYALTVLGEDKVAYLKGEIEKAERGYKKDGKRIYWEWYAIFVLSTLMAGYLTWRYGFVENVIRTFRATSVVAKAMIGTAVYSIAAMIGAAFTCICKVVKGLIK